MNLPFPEHDRGLFRLGGERRMDAIESNLPIIDEVLQHIRQRRHLSAEEWEDFRSWAWLKLVESDYAVLEKFEGRGSVRAYLAVVLTRYLLDYRVEKWGKWRPSAKAKKLGPEAVELEFLIQREGLDASDAVRTLFINRGCSRSHDELYALVARLPLRRKHWTSAEDWMDELPSHRPSPQGELRARDVEEARDRVEGLLERVLSRLEAEERVAVKMRFEQGLKLSEIALALGRNPKRFYRQFQRLMTRLRRSLENDGVDAGYLELVFSETN